MLKTFVMGGIHPPENKFSGKTGIVELPVPEMVVIPVSQHLGVPAKPVVEKGDTVKVGQIIAKSNGFVSSNIHSSVSGKVLKIDRILDISGYKNDAIVIQTEGDEWLEGITKSNVLNENITLSKNEIINKIFESGIVGLGGATFPSHVKCSVPRGKKVEYLVVNGVECEPYLTADHILMVEKGREIMTGIRILMKTLGVEKAIIGIENNKPDAIKKLKELAQKNTGIEVQELKVKYPQGGEKQLIKALLNREVPSGGLPIDVGAVTFNVGTAFSVYEAVQKNKPLFERIVTVTGKSLKKPLNLKVRIGTPVSKLIEAAGNLPENTGKIVGGGPMMGKAISDTSVPVIKGCSGILLLPDNESKRKNTEPCIRCSKCVSVCPMGLQPYLLMSLSEKKYYDRMKNERVMDCIECGSCNYICPAYRPLLDFIRLGKSNVSKILRIKK